MYTNNPVVELHIPVDTDAMEPDMVVTVGTFETSVLVLVFCGDVLALVVGVVVVDVLVVVVDVLIVVIGITKKYRNVQNY